MLLALASTVNSIPLPPISDRHGVRLPPPQHCLTNVNFEIVPNPIPEGFDDFEEQHPPHSSSTSATKPPAGENGTSQSTVGDTQGSSLFDTQTRRAQDEDDYDDDEEHVEGEDEAADDVSMTTVHPSQSQAGDAREATSQGADVDESRGVKRSLDEDEEYD